MAFVKIKGIKGMLYIPDEGEGPKKHSCEDCFSCNFCSDERCGLCLKEKPDSMPDGSLSQKKSDHKE